MVPFDRISIETGEVPSTKNSRPPSGAKNGCTETVSATRSVPKLTTPLAEPFGPAADFFGQALGPFSLMIVSEQLANPCGCSFTPFGNKTVIPWSGGGKPPYSVP